MASIPIQTTPTVGLEAGGFTPASAGPNVAPVRDMTGEQIQKMGQASQNLGATMIRIADNLQGEFDDARYKQMYNEYATKADEIELGFGKLFGADAAKQSTDFTGRLAAEMDRIAKTADNPMQERMFRTSAATRFRSANVAIQTRAVSQQREFDLGESTAQINTFITDASRRWETIGQPNSEFAMYSGAAVKAAEDLADKKGWGAGSAQRDKLILDTKSAITSQAVQHMVNDNKFIEAQSFLDKAFQGKAVDAGTYQTLQNAVGTGFRRQQGVDAGTRIYEGAGKAGATDFDGAVSWVLSKEGGYVADDAGKGASKYGINAAANPGVDIANLTVDQAKEIYKAKYWDAIGADKLPESIRAIAFDTAVNQGPSVAKRLVRESGGDFDKFVELRRAEYDRLVKSNPEKYARYKEGWDNRINDLVASQLRATGPAGSVMQPGKGREGQPNLQAMLDTVKTIADPQERQFAEAYVKERYNTEVALREENYRVLVKDAEDIAFSGIGAWQKIPAEMMARLKPEDQRRMVEGAPRGDDPDTVIKLLNDPKLWRAGQIEQFRGKLSESTYQRFFSQGNKPGSDEKILEATIDSEQFNATLLRNNMQDLINPKSGSTEQAQVIRLRDMFQQQIDAEQSLRGRKLTLDERQRIIDGLFMDKVYLDEWGRDPNKPLFTVTADEMEKAYVNVGGNEVKLSSIPVGQRRQIMQSLRRSGERITEQRIAELWVRAGKPK